MDATVVVPNMTENFAKIVSLESRSNFPVGEHK